MSNNIANGQPQVSVVVQRAFRLGKGDDVRGHQDLPARERLLGIFAGTGRW